MSNPRQVQKRIVNALQQGHIIQCVKTKDIRSGGRMHVSIGPQKAAVRGSLPPYCLITTGRYPSSARHWSYGTAIEAAQDFIELVGRSIAWAAVNKA